MMDAFYELNVMHFQLSHMSYLIIIFQVILTLSTRNGKGSLKNKLSSFNDSSYHYFYYVYRSFNAIYVMLIYHVVYFTIFGLGNFCFSLEEFLFLSVYCFHVYFVFNFLLAPLHPQYIEFHKQLLEIPDKFVNPVI